MSCPTEAQGVFLFDMAKELPFWKFEPSEWENGNIQMCSRESKGLFIDICSMYWSRLGELPYALALQKLCNGNKVALQELISTEIINIQDDQIIIEFLDEQLSEFRDVSQKRRQAAEKRWKKQGDANALQKQSKSNAIREEEKREEEKREEEKPKIKKKVWAIPDIDEFMNYYETVLQTDFPNRHFAVRNKYQAWVENDWKDGNNRSIKNWKTKLGATIQYLPEQKTNQNGAGQKSNIEAIADWVYGSRSQENTDDTERIE